MYKFLIKPYPMKDLYMFYTNADEEIYSTEDLEEMQEKYKELLQVYLMSQIKVVHELDPEVTIKIEENVVAEEEPAEGEDEEPTEETIPSETE